MSPRAAYLWDLDLDETQFRKILEGRMVMGSLDQAWAAARIIEYASYEEIVRVIGYGRLMSHWDEWRKLVRSESRKRGLDFLIHWIKERHPERAA
jgi:hypothetical protein